MKGSFLTCGFIFTALFNKAIAQPVSDDGRIPRLAIHSYATKPEGKSKKYKYKMDQFTGRWQETSRMKSGGKRVDVVDTLYLRFYDNNTADTKEGNYMLMNGYANVFDNGNITTSAADFRIVSANRNEIVLDDLMGYQHVLNKTNQFYFETKPPVPNPTPEVIEGTIDLSSASLMKNWFAYRRGANPGFVRSETPLLRNLRIKEAISNNTYKGEVEFAVRGESFVQPCTIAVNDRNISISTTGASWNMELYKANGQEIIAGKKGELVYYFKNL